MFNSHNRRPTIARRLLAATAAVCSVAMAATGPVAAGEDPQRDRKEPTAGVPYYLHFGPWGGLCTRSFDSSVEEGQIAEINGILYIRGDADEETFVEISTDDLGTADLWDDQLVVKLTVFANGPDVTETFTTAYWAPSDAGEIGWLSTQNVPQDRAIGFIYYVGSLNVRNAIDNNTAMPMRANGWFNILASGDDGFRGGSGPDCVFGAGYDNRVFTGGGADYVRTGHGNDLIYLGGGTDTAETNGGDDTIRGQGGNDVIKGGSGNDCYDGGSGHDVLDDAVPHSQQDQYMIDNVWNDYITDPTPFMVGDCM